MFFIRLTLTWDVLKLAILKGAIDCNMINFNMGCIETRKQVHRHRRQSRLTLTWDVLKHVLVGVDYLAELRLTLTWDVLKATNVQNIRNKTLFDEM